MNDDWDVNEWVIGLAFLCGIAFAVFLVILARLAFPELHWFL